MLTPVGSKPKKVAKADSGRQVAKYIILRRDVAGSAVLSQPPKVEKTDAGAQQQFTDGELTQLDALFDTLSWLICLLSGNYSTMNESGKLIGIGELTPEQAVAARD